MTAQPWDPGLQNERTGLAWQRTLLSGLSCGLLVARLLVSVNLALALVLGLIALLCTAGLGVVAVQRFRRHSEALHARRPIGAGGAQALLTLLTIVTAVGALLVVLVI